MYCSLIFIALLAVVNGEVVSRCVNNPGELPASVSVAGCSTAPCALPQLQDVVFDIEFEAPRNTSSMTTLATAYISMFPVPYDLGENAVTCNFLQDSSCPVTQGQLLRYQLRIYIENFFPVGIITTVEFRIVDDNVQPITCFRVPVIIGSPTAN